METSPAPRPFALLSLVTVLLCSFAFGCAPAAVPRSDVATVPSRVSQAPTHVQSLGVGLMYWAPARPLFCREWCLVVTGTVVETHEVADVPEFAPHTKGTVEVRDVLASCSSRRYPNGVTFSRLTSDCFAGVKPGDKVVVFAVEYDGGYGIAPISDTSHTFGFVVSDWKDPIVAWIGDVAVGRVGREEALRDADQRAVWRTYCSGENCWPEEH